MRKVLLTMRIVETQDYHEPRDAISQDWIRFLERCGLSPVLVPNAMKNPEAMLTDHHCEGLILSNGENVQLRRDDQGRFQGAARDLTEARLLACALQRNIPVVGYCRGLQFVNAYFGGKPDERVEGHVTRDHAVDIVEEDFRKILGMPNLRTNSYHNQGINIENLAPELKVFARCGDVVEGLFHPVQPVTAVQWHPERDDLNFEADHKLLDYALGRHKAAGYSQQGIL